MKKSWIISALIIVLLITVAVFVVNSNKSKTKSKTLKLQEQVNTVDVSNRPYVTLAPVTGKHPQGTQVEITVHNTTLDSTQAEYELEYQAGSLLQGAFGLVNFNQGKPPVSKTILLGTCSAGGKCDYNKEVSGGTLLLRLSGGQQKFAVRGEWSYQLMSARKGQFSSRDSKFRFNTGPKALPSSAYVIVVQTMGLPKQVDGQILAGPYHISSAQKPSLKSAEISIRLTQDAPKATLLGWTGKSWKKYKSQITDKTLTATVDSFATFLVTSPSQ